MRDERVGFSTILLRCLLGVSRVISLLNRALQRLAELTEFALERIGGLAQLFTFGHQRSKAGLSSYELPAHAVNGLHHLGVRAARRLEGLAQAPHFGLVIAAIAPGLFEFKLERLGSCLCGPTRGESGRQHSFQLRLALAVFRNLRFQTDGPTVRPFRTRCDLRPQRFDLNRCCLARTMKLVEPRGCFASMSREVDRYTDLFDRSP